MTMEEFKFVVKWYLLGLVVFWFFGVHPIGYSIGYACLAFCLWLVMDFWTTHKEIQDIKANREARQLRAKKLAAMTKEQRRELAKKEAEQRKINDLHSKQVSAKLRAEAAAQNKKRQEREEAREQRRKKKIPLSVKLAASAYLGYKAGKGISKW